MDLLAKHLNGYVNVGGRQFLAHLRVDGIQILPFPTLASFPQFVDYETEIRPFHKRLTIRQSGCRDGNFIDL